MISLRRSLRRRFEHESFRHLDSIFFQPVANSAPHLGGTVVSEGQHLSEAVVKTGRDGIWPGHLVNIQGTHFDAMGQSTPLPDLIVELTCTPCVIATSTLQRPRRYASFSTGWRTGRATSKPATSIPTARPQLSRAVVNHISCAMPGGVFPLRLSSTARQASTGA